MDTIECIKNRRTIRCFQNRPISYNDIEELVASAILAPSACNMQAWKFIAIDDPTVKIKLTERGSALISKAPQGILVLYRNDLSYNRYLYKDHIQSAAAAIENLLLVATEKDLAACWICNLDRPRKIKKLLNIPSNFDIIAYVALGYPEADNSQLTLKHFGNEEAQKNHIRKYHLDQVLSYNTFVTVPGDCTMPKPLPGVGWRSRFLKFKFALNHMFENHF
jgi:Nitroreductase